MKTIAGKVVSSKRISLSKAAKFLTTFVTAETEASQAVSAFLRRTSAAFNELNQLHKQLGSSRTDRKRKKHRAVEIKSGDVKKYVKDEEGGSRVSEHVKSEVVLVLENGVSNKEKRRKKGEDEEAGIEVERKVKSEIVESEGVKSDLTNEKHGSKKKRRKSEGGD